MAIVPPKLFNATTSNTVIRELYSVRKGMSAGDLALFHPDQPQLFDFFLPPFQRPLVWSQDQQIRFVESAYSGFHLGTYVVNDLQGERETVDGKQYYMRTDRWLIDGQQRLNALLNFWNDEFRVFQEMNGGFLWSETSAEEKRFFLMTSFAKSEVRMRDEHTLRLLYDRLNFGGTPHTPEQRALPEEEQDVAGPCP